MSGLLISASIMYTGYMIQKPQMYPWPALVLAELSRASHTTCTGQGDPGNVIRNTSVFTWKNLTYTVKTPSGERLLLDNVQGWVKPGSLTAHMGSSGAGKTTLLDVLAQRKTEGTIHGSILVNGRPLPVSFQRSAGYCEQLDIHECYATVCEAVEFSALLRQSRDMSRQEKLAYVDTIIDLLELHDLADTLIGEVGAGLSVEQRKRVTRGVELVARPSLLLFLDEPTSGLDGQSAYHTVAGGGRAGHSCQIGGTPDERVPLPQHGIVNNKLALHVVSALFNGFPFWMVIDSVGDLRLKLFTIFNFIFVAPGVLAQPKPLFPHRQDIFESREKKAKMYSWIAFVTGLVVSEMP
ncbi:hypothetical protein E4U41_002666 [Claviceps citrina]|nr:hypothetical protein E4U41_002666 [Claviceps citrina]